MTVPQLRPLGFGEVLDGAFSLYRRHFSTLVTASLVSSLPVLLLFGVLALAVSGMSYEAGMQVALIAPMVGLPILYGAIVVQWNAAVHLMARAYTGSPDTAKAALKASLRRILPGVIAFVLSMTAVGVGFVFLIVPGLLIAGALSLSSPAIMVEGKGAIASLERSWKLVEGSLGRVTGLICVAGLIYYLPTGTITVLSIAGGGMSQGLENVGTGMASPLFTMLSNMAGQLVQALVMPWVAGVMTLTYYDRRVRAEALDVQLAAQGLGDAPPAAADGWTAA